MSNHKTEAVAARCARSGAMAAFAAIVLFPFAGGAQSITRVDASRLSCDALQEIIWNRGEAIVRSRSVNSGMPLSERYVSDRRFCFQNEVARHRDVATRDDDYCSVKLCVERDGRRRRRN